MYNEQRTMSQKLITTSGVLIVMALLASADIILLEGSPSYKIRLAETGEVPEPVIDRQKPEPIITPPPEGGVRKNHGPNVLKTLGLRNFEVQETNEKIILRSTVTGGDTVEARALLIDGDRAGVIAWVSSPNVKKHYLVLKEALHSAFTPEVQDLLDETQRRENRPTRNLLTFYDPGLLPERVVFIRVRERLYEVHVAEGASEELFNVIEDLTK